MDEKESNVQPEKVPSTKEGEGENVQPQPEYFNPDEGGSQVESQVEFPIEVLFPQSDEANIAVGDLSDMEGQDTLARDDVAAAYAQMDPDEYLRYIQALLEEQGIDFNEWQQAMMEAAQQEQMAAGQFVVDGNNDEEDPAWWWTEGGNEVDDNGEDDEEEEDDDEDISDEGSELISNEDSNEFDEDSDEDFNDDDEEEETNLTFEQFMEQQRKLGKTQQKKLMGMKSFRYLQSRILSNFVKDTEDERIKAIQKKLKNMKRVSRPGPPDLNGSVTVLKKAKALSSQTSRLSQTPSKSMESEPQTLKEYSAREWAVKNAESFLRKSGCRSPEQSLTGVKVPEAERSNKLKVFLVKGAVGERRRFGIGGEEAAPEITAALRRQAERAMWRAIIDNSKPKYPLPRFILPRHKFLRKIESELIGPGSYEHDYWEKQRRKRLHSMPSMFRSCSSRFPKDKWRSPAADCIGDPYAIWEKACFHKRHPGKVPMFQSTPCNFRYKNFFIGCGLPPTHYNIRSPLEDFLKKSPSNRGMYDTSSGVDTFCTRKYKSDTESRLGPGAYDVRESIVKNLTDRYNYFKGKMSKTERRKMYGFKAAFEHPLWPVDNGYPGPPTYDPYEAEEWFEASWAPFGILAKARKPDMNIQSKLVAADYYHYGDGWTLDKGWVPEIFGRGLRSNFKSKTPMNTPEHYHIIIKERNKALNHHLDQDLMYKKKDPSCDTSAH